MEIRGRIVYCDKCGFKIFSKADERLEYMSFHLKYEKLPDGWKEFFNEHLCPKCSKEWDNFMGKKT